MITMKTKLTTRPSSNRPAHFWDSMWRDGFISNAMSGAFAIRDSDLTGRVLVVGCGDLKASHYLEKTTEYVGIDISTVALSVAKIHNPGAKLEQADACNLPFPDASFDSIVSTNTLPLLGERFEEALSEARRVLKVGGKIMFDVVHADWFVNDGAPCIPLGNGVLIPGEELDRIAFEPKGMGRELLRLGFRPIEIVETKHGEDSLRANQIPHWPEKAHINIDLTVRALRI
jgi:SAM-dependent methyltransferase